MARRGFWAALAAGLVLGAGAAAPAAAQPGTEEAAMLVELERRAARVRDIHDIKRLQHAYGFYLDAGMWDEAAGLFAEDGTIEIGLDGVYEGRARVREYLVALGGGRNGLPAGRLNAHLQVMPVVTVAPDGATAQARWRDILMVGTYGENAFWGEGPMENTYVKADGVWRIQSLHWHQNLFVPYEDGWKETADPTGGVHVSGVLPPDRPPTAEYETWPGVYMPPFHFPNPVSGPQPAPVAADDADAAIASEERAARAAALAAETARLEDENAVERLQRVFGYYIDEALWSEAAALFAEDATIEMGGRGVYEGRSRVLAFLRTLGVEGPQDGRLYDHMQLQPVVHVAPDGRTAQGRWRLFSQVAQSGEFAEWGLGVYENDYVKEDGVWKIAGLHLYERMTTPYESGWGVLAKPRSEPSESLPPDRPPTVDYATYPAAFTSPFHYDDPLATAPAEASAEAADLDALARRIGLLEDAEQIERLHAIYGYYLARNQWDDLAGIFAEDGTIEIAMRGVYAGRDAVRRNLNLYGEAGVQHGLLHNHMQFQPIVDVAENGQTAKVRSRALSIMGQHGIYASWMGGVYENDFVKRDGVWQFAHDHQINTYFAPYETGWKDLPQRPPPGITESNPPDAPPTIPFEMYPTAFIVPFHYANPVTGRAWTGWESED